jgi:8-oxo-dGTP pyrophosphatase MutT (NUDIX family)
VRDKRAGGETGLCQPECQYVYDLELSEDVVPVPDDNEAEDFRLLSVEEVREALAAGKFKPNCAVVLVDFFVRHGFLTPENEPEYIEVVSRMHRRLEFPTA